MTNAGIQELTPEQKTLWRHAAIFERPDDVRIGAVACCLLEYGAALLNNHPIGIPGAVWRVDVLLLAHTQTDTFLHDAVELVSIHAICVAMVDW